MAQTESPSSDENPEDSSKAVLVDSLETPSAAHRRLIPFIFVASGAAGLIYQVVWSRELVLLFGSTSQAVTTIVTAFMVGLGLGGFIGGRLADRVGRPLRIYGIVELIVAVVALILPSVFVAAGDVFRGAYPTLIQHPHWLVTIRFALALAAVAPATILMGMTLPILTRYFTRSVQSSGKDLGHLYAANTFGAVLGTIAAGFFLVEFLGLTKTAYIAVALNLSAGAVALILDSRRGAVPLSAEEPAITMAPDEVIHHGRKAILLATFVAGFVALALEILWTRMLSEGTGSRIYIFSMILAIYLFGIALGSSIFQRRSKPENERPFNLGVCLAAIGGLALTTVVLGSLSNRSVMLDVFILLPATIFMGYSFPLAGRLLMRSQAETGRTVGLLYAVNTSGSILGAFCAGFVLAPSIGTNAAVVLLASVNLVVAAWLMTARDKTTTAPADYQRKGRVLAGTAVLLAVVSLTASSFDMPLARTYTQNLLLGYHKQHPITGVTHSEDSLASIDTINSPDGHSDGLYINGVDMTSLTDDTKLMAYMSKAIRPDANRFLVIAFGMGGTYRAGLIDGLKTDVVELSPTVPTKMKQFFPDADKYLNNPNGRVINTDGRNYVRLSREKYDLLVIDPAPPLASAGSVVLYTSEFVQQSKARLNPGGAMMLWVPFDAPLQDWKDHMRTFRKEFSNTTFVLGAAGMYMFGSDSPMSFDRDALTKGLSRPGVLEDLQSTPGPFAKDVPGYVDYITSHVWLSNEQVDKFVGAGPLITDDNPRSEYYLWRRAGMKDSSMVSRASLLSASASLR